MKWRVISLEEHDAFSNMAIDETIMARIANKETHPTIRFYTWEPGAVSIGRFQSMADEVNLERCRSLGIDYVRRITGGGAVYHSHGGEITYSLIAPEKLFSKGIRESYVEICSYVIKGLEVLGIHADFAPINDILVNGRKISGSAQTRRQGVLLQHGTILYKLDIHEMFSLLNVSSEKISDKAIKSAEDRVTCVSDIADVSLEGLYKALLSGFTSGIDYEISSLSKQEIDDASDLSASYKSAQWNMLR
ncbi:MAG: lipoate--protein ligase family protein [Candidatus Marsarchaeota archaeon]|nr:lipoate--protein ligase family protein [Candidatus Marsarchaeota archaeon]